MKSRFLALALLVPVVAVSGGWSLFGESKPSGPPTDDKSIEERLALAANIFAGYGTGPSFNIRDYNTRVDHKNRVMYLSNRHYEGPYGSFSVAETAECRFKFWWNTDPNSNDSSSSTVDFSKLNLTTTEFVNSRVSGLVIMQISGIEGAVTHSTSFGSERESALSLPGIPDNEKQFYLNRVKKMADKFCQGWS